MTTPERQIRVQEGTMCRSSRSGAWLGLACLLPIAAMGCQGVIPRAKPKPLDSSTAIKGDGTGDKTQFRPDVGADQQVNVHLDLARAFEIQGNPEAAVAEYQKAVDACSAPGAHRGDHKVTVKLEALAQRRMGGALDRLGRFAQAEVHYRAALKASPNDA